VLDIKILGIGYISNT